MSNWQERYTRVLSEWFPGRFSVDRMERKIYGHDVGEMPPLVQPLIGKALADAVVQPESEAEIVRLVRWANEHRVPLVSRGKATSGYGGVLPVRGGIIVDFWRMRRILAVDPDALTVTVEPGIVWEQLERELGKRGLALRLYPSSAPSSTVGGWLAQGGFGYGSFEYGSFPENVVSARVVLPNGNVQEFSGDELALIADAEGITGIITQVTLRVRPLEEEIVIGARFDRPQQLAAALRAIVERGLPLWSVSFINPEMARLKNQRPAGGAHAHSSDGESRPSLPEAYLALFVFSASRSGEVQEDLTRIIAEYEGEQLPSDLAQHEWEERFRIMQIKRLGPSLIPTEVVLPLDRLDVALDDLERNVQQPLVIEGMVARGEQVILLGFIPHDRRRFSFNLAFALSLYVVQRAKRHGGRAYASGLYFAHEAEHILGADRLRRLREFKADVDSENIMNPGKILGNGLLGTFMRVAGAFEPLLRVVGNAARAPLGERPEGAGKRDVPDDVAWYAYACAQCGYCVDECDQFYGRGWESESPRAKWFFLREYMAGREDFDQRWVDKFLACTTCEVCNVECPLDLPNEPSWLKMRGVLVHEQGRLTFPPFEIMRAALRKERNIWAAYSRDRAGWIPEEIRPRVKEQAEVGYFSGCTAAYVEQDVAQGTARLLDVAGIEFTYMGDEETCCGLPMLVAGLWDDFADIVRHNIEGMKARGVKTVVTSCPSCWLSWKSIYPQWAEKMGIEFPFEVKHYSEVIAERVKEGTFQFTRPVEMKVTWHDSCHMGRAGGIYDPPRDLLKAVPGLELVEMEHNREHAHCCGSVLTLLENPDAGKVIGDVRVREAEEVGAEALVASCPCCEVQFRVTMKKTGRDMRVIDLAHLLAEAAGFPLPDPTDYALDLWGTFEAMIWLMKPKAMAGLMQELFPQMVDAMPLGMGKMMRAIGRMPGGRWALKAMKPLFPVLFPLLMPGMMGKVMPDMLKAVEKRVPMPQYMKEQMPDLMPMAMESLMPKMLPQLVPLISDPLIDYLSGKSVQ